MAYKLFSTGEVLTAANVNNYLMNQTVMVFASAAARTTALSGVLAEGMISYRSDAHVLESYTGSAWVTAGSSVTTKGDLQTFDTAPTRLPVGSDGQTLVADSSATTGLRYQSTMAAGKNGIINGGFDIWQRATSSTTTSGYLTADRWYCYSGGAVTWARESTTVAAGSLYSMKITAGASIQPILYQAIETLNATQYAGQNVTLSVLAQASTTTGINVDIQWSASTDVGPAGSWTTLTATSGGSGNAVSGSFTKINGVFAIPSTAKSLMVRIYSNTIASGVILYYDQAQLELGVVPTTFSRAGGTIQGELAACQRYYFRANSSSSYGWIGSGIGYNTTTAAISTVLPSQMRVPPTAVEFSTLALNDGTNNTTVTTCTIDTNQTANNTAVCNIAAASGIVQYRPYYIRMNASASAYIGFTAEL
jgi:hypothetical protein